MGKMLNNFLVVVAVLIMGIVVGSAGFWDVAPSSPTSASGLTMQHVSLTPVKDGMSMEQYNIKQRYIHDNQIGGIKYVYVLGENGQVCMHFVISNKVTSSGKRLTPRTVAAYGSGGYTGANGMSVTVGSETYETTEVIEDDGTYGDSIQYIYMTTTVGNYVQIIPMGSFLTVVSDKQLTPTELTYTFSKN